MLTWVWVQFLPACAAILHNTVLQPRHHVAEARHVIAKLLIIIIIIYTATFMQLKVLNRNIKKVDMMKEKKTGSKT